MRLALKGAAPGRRSAVLEPATVAATRQALALKPHVSPRMTAPYEPPADAVVTCPVRVAVYAWTPTRRRAGSPSQVLVARPRSEPRSSPVERGSFSARLLSGGVLFSLQFRSGFLASCAVGVLLTVLGYFAAVPVRGVANSAFGGACRNFQELGVSPDQRRKACVKAGRRNYTR